jgi:hypothetical protein
MATLNSSNITDGNTIEPTDILQLYDALTPGGGTTGAYNVTVSGSLIGNASTSTSASFATSASRAVTSSFAITASYALNGGGGASSTVTLQRPGITALTAKPFAGSGSFSSGIATINMSTAFPDLSPSALGVDLFVTATAASNTEYVGVAFTSPNLVFRSSASGASSGTFYYQGWSK